MKKIVLLIMVLLVTLLVLVSGCEPKCKVVTKSVKGCDKMQGCDCIHESWGGLGACDSCECEVCK